MQKVISIRPTEEFERKLERLMKIARADRSAVVRRALDIGIDQELKKYALELFRDKKISLAKAAELAGISVREMMDLIKEGELSVHITSEEIRKDFEAAMKSAMK